MRNVIIPTATAIAGIIVGGVAVATFTRNYAEKAAPLADTCGIDLAY